MTIKTKVFGPGLPNGEVLAQRDLAPTFIQAKLDEGPRSVALQSGGTYFYYGGAGSGVTFLQWEDSSEKSSVPTRVR